MRVRVFIKMYKGKLELYGDGEDFTVEMKINEELKQLSYSKDDDMFKPVLVISPGDVIYLIGLPFPYIFHRYDEERWQIYNIAKNKVLKNKRKYLLATTPDSAKKGLFHNIQKEKTRAIEL